MSRNFLNRAVPAAYDALIAFSDAATAAAVAAGVTPIALELVKIRASQINGCAYCLRMHVRDAIALGETSDRLAVIAAWRDTEYFTPQEQAALAIAEQTTLIGDHTTRTPDDLSALDAQQIATLEWAAITINAFNRVSILSGFDVRP